MTSLEKFIFMDIREGNIVNTEEKRLTLAYEDLKEMPKNLIEDYGHIVEILDISYNKFRQIEFLTQFDKLTTLIMDHNLLSSEINLPYIPTLTTLWLNHNLIDKLHPFIESIHKSYPKLKFLSLMGNPGAPSYLNGGTYYEYLHYRLFIISWLPNLQYLDDKTITQDQRIEAVRLYGRPFYKHILNFEFPHYFQHVQDQFKFSLSNFFKISLASKKPSIRNTNLNHII